MKITKEQAALAAKLLKITEKEAVEYSFEIEDMEAVYISVPVKGGGSLIVSDKLEVLYAISAVSYKQHIEAFISGIRTPLEAFEETEE